MFQCNWIFFKQFKFIVNKFNEIIMVIAGIWLKKKVIIHHWFTVKNNLFYFKVIVTEITSTSVNQLLTNRDIQTPGCRVKVHSTGPHLHNNLLQVDLDCTVSIQFFFINYVLFIFCSNRVEVPCVPTEPLLAT